MANFEIEGRLLRKYDTDEESQTFPSREFVVETLVGDYSNCIKFQLTGERCALLDLFEEGETIKVYFELKGAEQAGRYLTTLHTLRLSSGRFKYQSKFDGLSLQNCPPSDYRNLKMTCYRYVFQDLSNENNFLPAALIKPERVNSAKDNDSKCKIFGLSLFQDEQGAMESFKEWMAKTNNNFVNIVGDHLATVEIEDDGVGGEPNYENFSHFTFHEYAHADLSSKISKVETI